MSKKKTDVIASGVILIGCAMFFIQTLKFEAKMPGDIGSGLYPQIVLGGIVLMCLIKVMSALMNKDEAYCCETVAEQSDVFKGLCTIVLLGLYVFAFKRIGFLLTSIVYLFLQLLVLSTPERRGKKDILLYSIIALALPIIIQVFFVKILRLMLPAGILIEILM